MFGLETRRRISDSRAGVAHKNNIDANDEGQQVTEITFYRAQQNHATMSKFIELFTLSLRMHLSAKTNIKMFFRKFFFLFSRFVLRNFSPSPLSQSN